MPSRDAYVEMMKLQLAEWGERINMLHVLTRLAKQEVRDEVEERMEHMHTKRDEFKSKVRDLQNAGEESSISVRRSIEKVNADLRQTYDDVKSNLTR